MIKGANATERGFIDAPQLENIQQLTHWNGSSRSNRVGFALFIDHLVALECTMSQPVVPNICIDGLSAWDGVAAFLMVFLSIRGVCKHK